MLTPIVLFVYNRPWHTCKTVEALQRNELASESDLYIFADGPKDNSSDEEKNNLEKVRNYIHTIDGFKNITISESNHNIGLDYSVISAVTNVIEKHKRVIVVEDDIVTHPFFLKYMNQALDTYENNKDIFMISGFSYNLDFPKDYNEDIYCVHRCCSWGWGMWYDRWCKTDWELSNYNKLINSKKEIRRFNRGGNDLFKMLQVLKSQPVCAWDIRWYFCMYEHNALCVNPKKSLVKNIGLDGSGTHKDNFSNIKYSADFPNTDEYYFKFTYPLTQDSIMDKQIRFFLDGSPTLFKRVKYSITKRMKKIGLK